MLRSVIVTTAAFALLAPAVAQAPIPSERVSFAPGTTSKTIRASIKGDSSIDYLVGARAGQSMMVELSSSNASNYFNIIAPGKTDEAMFAGSSDGNRFEGRLPASGDYRVRVYLMRNAARRNEVANYTLTIGVSDQSVSDAGFAVPPGTGSPISPGNMAAFCRGQASQQYGVRPYYLKNGPIKKAADGASWIDGTVDQGANGIKEFRCRFDSQGRFVDVMAMTPDGE